MKTITGTIPASFLRLVGEEAQNKRAFAMIEKPVRGVALKSTRTDPKFQAYIAPLVNPNIIDAFNGHAPMPVPQQEPAPAQVKAGDFVIGGIYRCANGDIVRMCGFGNSTFIGTSYETMYDELGVHRYTNRSRSDQGRVTGSAPNEPRNIVSVYSLPVAERAEFAPEVKGDADGWIEWKGSEDGSEPREKYESIQVRCRNGEVHIGKVRDFRWWHFGLGDCASMFDAVAYRLAK